MFSSSSPSKIPVAVVVKSSAVTTSTSSRAQWTSVSSPSASARVSFKSAIPRPVRASKAATTSFQENNKSICTPTAITQHGLLTPPPTPPCTTLISTPTSKSPSQKPRAASVTPTLTGKTDAVTPPQKSTRPPSAKTPASNSTPRKVLNKVAFAHTPSPASPIPRAPRFATHCSPTPSCKLTSKPAPFSFATPTTPVRRAKAPSSTLKEALLSPPLDVVVTSSPEPISDSDEASTFDFDTLSAASSQSSLLDEECPFSSIMDEESPFSSSWDEEEGDDSYFLYSGLDEDYTFAIEFATATKAFNEAMQALWEAEKRVCRKTDKMMVRIRALLVDESVSKVSGRRSFRVASE